jgi:hypothetical protein
LDLHASRPPGVLRSYRLKQSTKAKFVAAAFVLRTKKLDQVDPSILDVLTAVYEPEGKALKGELYQARGDQESYQRIRSEILSQAPGLRWWVRRLDQKAGFLASFRIDPGHLSQ